MHYKQSQEILEEVKKADKILLNCHRNPDPDSIGSALSMKLVLEKMGKEVVVICPSENLFENINYLKGYNDIKTGINFGSFNFSKFDLFITLDSGGWNMVAGSNVSQPEDIKIAVIDHHETNSNYGDLNLVDKNASSVAEMLYLIYKDWGAKISKEIGECIMAGIVGDTGALRYPGISSQVLRIVADLVDMEVDKDFAVDRIYRSEPLELIKFYSEALKLIEIDRERKFVYSIIPYEIYSKLGKPSMAKESTASMFTQVVEGTDFGFVALEKEPQKISVSLRSRTGFDTSKIAVALGGGGHVYASGGKIEGLDFEKAKEKLLQTVRAIVDESKK